MAKDRKKLQHIHSSVPDKQPTPASLKIGELAVNNAANQEFISTKNSNDKVVRFSSDEQIITWTEKKEVIPYSGTVENIHLDTNRSNIEIKLNQVVAHNTVKNDVVNGAKDIDGNLVNPSSDGGLTNGAGFAIDTSAFALHGGNPEFSSITVTCRSELNGTTIIQGVNGGCGSLLGINVNTENVSATTLNQSGNTYNVTANTENHNVTSFTVNSTSACVMSTDTAGIGGDLKTNVGTNCQGSPISNVTNIYGDTINNSGATANTTASIINNTATTINNNVTNYNITGTTKITGDTYITGTTNINGDTNITGDTKITKNAYISGDTYIGGTLCANSGLCKTLSWTYGSVCNANSGSTNFKGNESFIIPKTISDVTCGDVVDENPGTTSGCLTIGKDVCVTGKVTASNGFFQSSDRRLKENIVRPEFDKFIGANKTPIKQFNYIGDSSRRKTYGVIAQEAEANGLEELIHTDDNGNKAVDYTSLLILKIGFLENEIKLLRYRLNKLDGLN